MADEAKDFGCFINNLQTRSIVYWSEENITRKSLIVVWGYSGKPLIRYENRVMLLERLKEIDEHLSIFKIRSSTGHHWTKRFKSDCNIWQSAIEETERNVFRSSENNKSLLNWGTHETSFMKILKSNGDIYIYLFEYCFWVCNSVSGFSKSQYYFLDKKWEHTKILFYALTKIVVWYYLITYAGLQKWPIYSHRKCN